MYIGALRERAVHLEVARVLVNDGSRWEGLHEFSAARVERQSRVVLSERRDIFEIGRGCWTTVQEWLSRQRRVAMDGIASPSPAGQGDFHYVRVIRSAKVVISAKLHTR